MEYGFVPAPWHLEVTPEGADGVPGAGLTATVKVDAGLDPHVFDAVTPIFPEEEPKVTEMDVVPWPELITAPAGVVQLYEVAPATGAMEYV